MITNNNSQKTTYCRRQRQIYRNEDIPPKKTSLDATDWRIETETPHKKKQPTLDATDRRIETENPHQKTTSSKRQHQTYR